MVYVNQAYKFEVVCVMLWR